MVYQEFTTTRLEVERRNWGRHTAIMLEFLKIAHDLELIDPPPYRGEIVRGSRRMITIAYQIG